MTQPMERRLLTHTSWAFQLQPDSHAKHLCPRPRQLHQFMLLSPEVQFPAASEVYTHTAPLGLDRSNRTSQRGRRIQQWLLALPSSTYVPAMGVLPKSWTRARIALVFRKDGRYPPFIYQRILLISSPIKVLERIFEVPAFKQHLRPLTTWLPS